MTDDRAVFPAAAPAGPASSARPIAADSAFEIGSVRFRELRAVARLQRRAFRPRLAYGLLTLVLLWALPHVAFLVARREEVVVGCAIGDRQDGQARVINLAVDPAARRQGIGRALLAALEAELPRGDFLLMVEEENEPARALYEAAGYARVGVARDYYGRGRHGLWMQKRRPGSESAPKKVRV
jgi:ribosomal-protein-alanine N-acetyltransferase